MEKIDLTKEKCDSLLIALNRIRRHLCAYCPLGFSDLRSGSLSDRFCDCKYGADHIGSKSESGNGCPEMRMAMEIVKAYFDLTHKPKRKRKKAKKSRSVFDQQEQARLEARVLLAGRQDDPTPNLVEQARANP